jgi:superfamily II DNA or RNA helicase
MGTFPQAPDATSWLNVLSFLNLMHQLGAPAVEAALKHSLRYVRPPSLQPGGKVVARLEKTGKSRSRSVRVYSVSLTSYPGTLGIRPQCVCNPWNYCSHTLALLLDLAVAPALRQALLHGAPVEPAMAELPALRVQALRTLALEQVLAQWTPPGEPAPPLEYTLAVVREPPRDWYVNYGGAGFPQLELRARVPGSRAMLDAREVHTLGLRSEDQRILSLAGPMSRNRKGFAAGGVHASMLLQLLRGRAVTVEKSLQPVRFADVPVALQVVREAVASAPAAAGLHVPPHDLGWDDDFDEDDLSIRFLVPSTARRAQARAAHAARAHKPAAPPPPVDALQVHWVSADGAVDVPAREATFFSGPYPWVWVPATSTFHPVDPAVDQAVAQRMQRAPVLPLDVAPPADVYRALRSRLRGRAVALPPAEAMGLPPVEKPAIVVRIDGQPLDVVARVEARYASETVALGPAPVALDQSGARDVDAEDAAVARVTQAGLRFDPEARAFVAAGEDAVAFWQKGIAQLREAGDPGLELVVAERLRNVRFRAPVRSRVRVALAGGWLDTDVAFDAEEHAADMAALREAIARGRRWVALDDGSLAEITDTVAELVGDVSSAMPGGSRGRLAPHQLGRLERWIESSATATVDAAVEGLRTRLRALAVQAEPALPTNLAATLRPYQRRGLAWLQFLDELGAGGVLADDMGLGKTLMTLALLQHRKERDGAKPSLVVCPTSVASNWVREAARFAPGLRVLLLHGAGRQEKRADIAESDLVVTTYALLRADIETLEAESFRYAILDEAQNIKNAEAVTTQAARRLRAERRLALTGTPIENRLVELWSIMDFCNPGMLGTAREFEARFERPIALDPQGQAARTLHALIRPFVLRRTKREVLTDLPAKEEIDQGCVLGPRQRKLYDALAATLREEVEEKIREQGMAKSGLSILTALLRLRQMACDPRLVDPSLPASASAKREAFLERVRELVAEGRRALVFSQFVELLTLWRRDLEREGIAYEYLDGRTRDRDAVVARFQNGSAPLFLISLRAGGAGLNLTAADTVIHCDPWWNPAVEDQATDRAHRIGQQRAVTVYRLVARGTLEERIMALKAAKKGLAEAVIREDAGALRGLTAEDVRALLGAVEGEVAEDSHESEPPPPGAKPSSKRSAEASQKASAEAGERVTGAALEALARQAQAWLRRTGRLQRDIAEQSGVAQTYISQLVNRRLKSLPAVRAEAIRAVVGK